MVVIETPHDIASVASDVDVFCYGREDERIHREVRLQKSAVRLRLHRRQLDGFWRDTKVKPWGHLRHLEIRIRTEQ